jgi:hypothetical protein
MARHNTVLERTVVCDPNGVTHGDRLDSIRFGPVREWTDVR